MLRSARPIPRRFNRRVSPLTQSVVRRHHELRRTYSFERLQRLIQRLRRRIVIDRKMVLSGIAGLAIVVVLSAIGIIFFSPLVTVHEIRVQRTDPRIDFEQVQNALAPVYGRELFFLTSGEIQQLLRDAIPDLDSVEVRKEYPRSVLLKLHYDPIVSTLQIRDPDGVVINHLGSGANVGGDYLTTRGMYVVYSPSLIGSGTQLSVLDVVDWGVRPSPWTQIIDPEMLTMMRKAEVSLLDQFGTAVTRRTIFLRAREFHLRAGRINLWFDLRSPLSQQLQRLRIFLDTVGLDQAKEYVDLRVKDKILYR